MHIYKYTHTHTHTQIHIYIYIGVVRYKSYKVGGWWSLACTLGATWEGVTSGEGNIYVTRRFEGAGLTVFA